MSHQTEFWQKLAATLAEAETVMLLIVAASQGSSPGKAGAKMAVPLHSACFGTIGGGAIEQRLIKQARRALADGLSSPRCTHYRHNTSNSGQASGMICGGEQTILRYRCQADDRDLSRQLALHHCNRLPGILTLSPQGLTLKPNQTLAGLIQFNHVNDSHWRYEEAIGVGKQAYLIGGGHVSLALSKILAMLDYDIIVIDERPRLDTLESNADAHYKLTLPYHSVGQAVPEGEQVFVFIMTHSHKTDEIVAAQLATKKLAYLGLLGSHQKVAQLKTRLSAQLSKETLNNIHAPIGLPIYSHTPAEIAVSIAAELIQIAGQQY